MTGSHHLREPNHGLGEKESVLVAFALSLLAAPYAYWATLPGPGRECQQSAHGKIGT